MTTTGPRPFENTSSSRIPTLTKRSRKANPKKPDFSSASRPGYIFPQNCTINALFQQKFTTSAHAKSQASGEGHLDAKRRSYTAENDNNYTNSYNPCKYEKKGSFKSNLSCSSYDKNSRNSQVSTASESEGGASSGSSSSSELNGFKIVQEGKIVHNEAEEELDSPRIGSKSQEGANFWHFASSLMVIGPNVKEISIPDFA